MFLPFFRALRAAKIPVSLREFLDLLEAVSKGLPAYRAEQFYYLSRSILVKDERHFDRFDQVFSTVFKGIGDGFIEPKDIPEEWLQRLAELHLSPDEIAKIEALGDWEEIMKALAERLAEQNERHQGGSKWIGTAGTSPFGAYGYNPAGIRIGQHESRHRRAIKVWDRREYQNFADDIELGTRTLKMALRKLRAFSREGADDELDLDQTITATAANAGYLDLKFRPERHNNVKILLLLDVGGSMDDHVRTVEELFSACRAEFKHLEVYYFHNCLYEGLWRDNARRHDEAISAWQVLNTYGSDYRVFLVGDASMSPYEIVYAGGAVEHYNEESGDVWLARWLQRFPHVAWLNPVPEAYWSHTPSIEMIQARVEGRMFPLTLAGLEAAVENLKGKRNEWPRPDSGS